MQHFDNLTQQAMQQPMQQNTLKALAHRVLNRNKECNTDATKSKKPCNKWGVSDRLNVASKLTNNATTKLTGYDRKNIQEHLEERAAIQEIDGGLSRQEAEKQARSNMKIYRYQLSDCPGSWLVVIMPGYDINEARESLTTRFQKRLIKVKKYAFNSEILK